MVKKTKLLSNRARLISTVTLCLLVQAATLHAQQGGAVYQNPVMGGDYPDPSITRVGGNYWATSTSSDWAPEFPILHSRDLVNWNITGAVFHQRPSWSDGNYWAPEISEYRGSFYVYYVGHKKDGPLCVAVATAPKASGPYTDHGPLVCQEDGSIDPMAVVDERGQRYLVWKEDGNSRNQPTPIWAQKLSPDGTRLVGDKQELIRNDAPWEAQLVEGPFVLHRGGWFYLFYSGNACCGRECNYALGVARSRTLLGQWEKDPANPILKGNEWWKCPGHGSIVVDPSGRDFFLYHAYSAKDSVYVGRQAMLDRVEWNADGWPVMNGGNGPSHVAPAPFGVSSRKTEYRFTANFATGALAPGWEWPQANEPHFSINGGRLLLSVSDKASDDFLAGVLARSTTTSDYIATTLVDTRSSAPGAGISVYGDHDNAIGIAVKGAQVLLWRREKNQQTVIATAENKAWGSIYLRISARGGHFFRFAFSGNGRNWTGLGEEMDGSFLPPWDRGVRIALNCEGRGACGFKNMQIGQANR